VLFVERIIPSRIGDENYLRGKAPMKDHVYKTLEITGSSDKGIEDAVNTAVAKANETVRNIHWFEVVETRGYVENGSVSYWQVSIKLGFKLE
jgi:flavin-binding protein dodecin